LFHGYPGSIQAAFNGDVGSFGFGSDIFCLYPTGQSIICISFYLDWLHVSGIISEWLTMHALLPPEWYTDSSIKNSVTPSAFPNSGSAKIYTLIISFFKPGVFYKIFTFSKHGRRKNELN